VCACYVEGAAKAEVATYWSSYGQSSRDIERRPARNSIQAPVRVTNSRNGRSIIVRINDRGPFVMGRAIDLSSGAAQAIGMGSTGNVSMEVIR
jgi:hypothetical protein